MGENKGVEIHDLLGLSQPITKFVETIAIGIGKVYEPWHIERIAKAKAKEIEAIASAIVDNIHLPTKYKNGEITIDSKDINDLMVRVQNRLFFQEIQKQQNIDSVVAGAYNLLENETEVSYEPVGKDWILRFFNSVEDVTDEDLQELWSKILAGEIKRPKSFSMRTLDMLHNISKDEALLIEKVCKCCISGKNMKALYRDDTFLEKCGLQYSDILRLDECGFFANSSGFVQQNFEIASDRIVLFDNKDIVIIAKSIFGNLETIELPVYYISTIGLEIINLFGHIINNNLLLECVKSVKKLNTNISITAHKISYIKDDSISFNGEIDLLQENHAEQEVQDA